MAENNIRLSEVTRHFIPENVFRYVNFRTLNRSWTIIFMGTSTLWVIIHTISLKFSEGKKKKKKSHVCFSFSFPEVLSTDEDVLPGSSGLAQGHGQMAADSNSEYSCVSADSVIPYVLKTATQQDAAHPKSSAVVPPGGEAAKQQSSASEYFSCFSTLSELIRANEDEVLNTSEDVLSEPSGLAQGHGQMAADAVSQYSCVSADKLIRCEFKRTTQEDAAQPKSSAMVPPGVEAAEEKSSASQYCSCVSSLSELIRANEHATQTHWPKDFK
ncbi:uncharacterized protein LOC122916303 isoform X2 [Neovison vison]|uniref:uncharacterized protein LOC122916303 isoform X2 n=1 Tax=Neovison vison TaxID=452646 RepID=UPI001CF0772F|nr:uncharacterized protein LOC122916303 isoform X2 [Neogale vison]